MARLRAIPASQPKAEPRRGSYWSARCQMETNTSWSTSAADSRSRMNRTVVPKSASAWRS